MLIPALYVDRSSILQIKGLRGDETITDYTGSIEPQVAPGGLAFDGNGWIYNLRLSNGSFYPCQERRGIVVADASSNRRHARLQSSNNTQRVLVPSTFYTHLHELSTGHNSYFIGQGRGFSVKNYPIPDNFTVAMLVASQGAVISLDVGTGSAEGTVNLSSIAKWLTLRKSGDVWQLWADGTRLTETIETVDDIAGDFDALIGSTDLPLATREFRLWNRALLDTEIPSEAVAPPAADIAYSASSSTKNPVKNLAGEGYDGVGQPVIANVPANGSLAQDAYGQPCTIMSVLSSRSTLPDIRSSVSYNDWRKPVNIGEAVNKGERMKVLMATKTTLSGRVSRQESLRVLEIAK